MGLEKAVKKRMAEKFEAAKRAVWLNDDAKRYVPLSLDGGTGWGIFDRRVNAFVSDKDVPGIDAREPYALN